MSVENDLKELILTRYSSLREFTIAIDMSYSTFNSIITRGIQTANIANALKICRALNISADALGRGEIAPVYRPVPNSEGSANEVMTILDVARSQLQAYDHLTFNGKPADLESVETIIDAIEIGIEIATRKRSTRQNVTKSITQS